MRCLNLHTKRLSISAVEKSTYLLCFIDRIYCQLFSRGKYKGGETHLGHGAGRIIAPPSFSSSHQQSESTVPPKNETNFTKFHPAKKFLQYSLHQFQDMPAIIPASDSAAEPEAQPLTRLPFKPVTREHILHCSYDYWHPKQVHFCT